jgi:cytochrome c oxidase assembly factor CtaG
VTEPLTWSRALAGLSVEPLALAGAAFAAWWYGSAVREQRRAGRPWPARRTAAFAGGLGVVLVATQSGLAGYDDELLSVHAGQHLALALVAPVLLVAGRPVALVLRSGAPRGRTVVRRALHGPVARGITHPLVIWLLFAGTVPLLYLSPLLELSLRHAWLHELVHAHLLASGLLFAALAIGVEPLAGRVVPAAGRVLAVALVIPLHAFVGVAVLSADHPLAGGFYVDRTPGWGPSTLADQRLAGLLLWVASDAVALGLVAWVFVRWMADDARRARIEDARDDAERGLRPAAGG